MDDTSQPFHLAVPVNDLAAASDFYCGVLGCGTGRTVERWIDLNFFGHELSLHLVEDHDGGVETDPVDGDKVPARHFGNVLDPSGNALEFKSFADDTQLFAT